LVYYDRTMRPRSFPAIAAALLLCARPAVVEAQATSALYNFISSYFNPDPNAGLTAFRSLLIPMGGLAEGMGMAYTAAARDSSYFEANPAASSVIDQTELAVFHNNWIADTRIEGAVYTIRTGNLGFGAMGKWLYLPFTGTNDFGDRIGSGYYSEATVGFNVSYNFLHSYTFNGIALGATAKLAWRSVPTELAAAAGNSGLAAMIDAGALVRFNFLKPFASRTKNSAVGLAIKNLGPPVQGEALPTVASAGFSWSPFRPLNLSTDLSQPINLLEPAKSELPSIAGGFSLSMTDSFGFQGGLLIKGGNPRLSLGSTFALSLVKVTVNYTLDLTTQFTPLNRISIQAAFALGDLGRAELARKVDRLYLDGLSDYGKGNLDAAIALWTEAARLDPSFDPVRDSLRAAENAKKLKADMDAIGKMDLTQPGQ